MTDPHVHFRDWNQSEKETVYHGMLTGALSGFDTFFDMPNTSPAVTTREAVLKRIELGASAEQKLEMQGHEVHYHLYCGLTPEKAQIAEMVKAYRDFFPRICGLKMFASQSTGNMGITEEEAQAQVYRTLTDLGYTGVLAVHCEKESLFDSSASRHSDRRPSRSEAQSVRDQISFAQEAGFAGMLHIAHISTKGALDEVRAARERGIIRITCGATPHHILLNRDAESEILKMNPPLRPEEDRLAVWNGLFDGTIDWIESDHAPHTLDDKKIGASGIPGFEGMLRAICALRAALMPESRLTQLLCTNALKAFGIGEKTAVVPEITSEMIASARGAYPFSAWS